MKKNCLITIAVALLSAFVFAQTPEAFKYQAAVRDGAGQTITNQSVSFRISIVLNNPSGTTVFSETHTATTNAHGLVNLEIGNGVPLSGVFSTINWGADDYFVKIEMDPAGGNNYQLMGTSQLVSVPYAMHARTASSVPGDNDASPTNEIQALSLSGNTLSLSGANNVNLSNVGPAPLWQNSGQNIYSGTNSKVAIGNNSNPDLELVVGENIGYPFSSVYSRLSVGNHLDGGVIAVGSPNEHFSILAGAFTGRAEIASTSPAGYGKGEIEIRTNGVSIGDNPGSPGDFTLKVDHGSFGLNIARANTDNHWEILTGFSTTSSTPLYLYANNIFRGQFNPTNGTYSSSSDRRLKSNIRNLESVLDKLVQLKPARYRYIANNPKNEESIGFIAQEVKEFFPEMVHVVNDERSKGMHSMNYAGMSVVAIKAIQEQQAIINTQEARIQQLETRLTRLESILKTIGQ